MANYQHPGVYIQEIPSTRSIQGASTSMPAFIGVTDSGPLNTPTLITSWNAYTRLFGGLVWMGFTSWAVYEFFQEGGAACYVSRVADKTGAPATTTVGTARMVATTNGTWGASLMYYISNSGGPPTNGGGTPPPTPVFNVQIVVQATTIDGAGANADKLSTQLLVNYVRQNGLAAVVIGGSSYYVLETFSGLTFLDAAAVGRINSQSMFVRLTLAGPKDSQRPGNTPTPTALSGGTNGQLDFTAAQKAISTVQGLSLLAQPDTASIVDSNGKSDPIKQAQLINQGMLLCETLANLFYAADPPFGQDVQQIVAFKSGTLQSGGQAQPQAINSSYGSLYYPWLWIFNPLSGSNVPIPPSGPVLGRYAHTDSSVGVWKSPAGVNDGSMRTVVGVERPITDDDQSQLNPNGVNAVRNLINYGNVIYGARTVSQDTQWTYLSVRRLFIYVEQSLKNSLQWVVFESNDQTLWAAVTRDIDAFLTTLWQQGGLFGATPQEAFFVTCDATNNPPETRMLGQLYIDIGLAPVYPAEFVIIRITQKTAGPDSGS